MLVSSPQATRSSCAQEAVGGPSCLQAVAVLRVNQSLLTGTVVAANPELTRGGLGERLSFFPISNTSRCGTSTSLMRDPDFSRN
jgi:hypothetical protein